MTTGSSGTPLLQKLGVRDGSRVLLDGAPDGFELGVPTSRRAVSTYDVALLFAPDLRRLERRWPVLHERVAPSGRLWVCWPKKASGVPTDLDDDVVRAYGLAHGRVDVKVCAIDATWSGLAFVVRLADR